jgi:hypothetical protein
MDARFIGIGSPPFMRKRLRYADLVALGIIRNRVTLRNWIRSRGFPSGQLTGPNTRTWGEDEVEAWLKRRPTAPRMIPQVEGKRGRRRRAKRARR